MNTIKTVSDGNAGKPEDGSRVAARTRVARATFDLLMAGDWLAKCDVVARERPLLDAVRVILREEALRAQARGDWEDASLYAAHVSLLDDIERRGLAPVQAEIIRAMR